MKPAALISPGHFGLWGRMVSGLPVFRRELADLPSRCFVPYPDEHLHDGGWSICPIVLRWERIPDLFDIADIQRRCPGSRALLAAEPQVLMGGFSRLQAGCRVREHADRPLPGVLRLILVLASAEPASLVLAGHDQSFVIGSGAVFDHSLPHSSHHPGPGVRDMLIVDFLASDAERDLLRELRGGVNLGPTASSPP